MEDTIITPPADLGEPPAGHRWASTKHQGATAWYAVPADDHRPVMTESEASFHTTVAGIRARTAAAGHIPAEAKLALGQLAAADRRERITVAGQQILPVSIATLWAYEDCSKLLGDPTQVSIFCQHCLTWLLLHRPDTALDLGIRGDRASLIAHLAVLAEDIDPVDADALDDWFLAELGRIRTLAGGSANEGAGDALGKPSMASSASNVAAMPPPDGL